MNKKLVCALLGIALFGLAGCATNHNVRNQVNSTGINLTTAPKGSDCAYFLFGAIPLSRTNIDQAAKNGKVTSLGFVEYDTSYYVLFSKKCVTVYGNRTR